MPPLPTIPATRQCEDLERLADLSVLGFKDSEIFRFERPYYDQFPQDAIASFTNIYRSQLTDPRAVVVVAEDLREPDDDVVSHSTSPDPNSASGRAHPQRIVVAIASWIFPEGSSRTGQFVVPDVSYPEPILDRDLCRRRLELFTRVSNATEKKYFTGKLICNKLVVHPSYRHRGHATSLLRWGLRLSDQDVVGQGVIPAHMGQPSYLALGYKIIGEMTVPDDGEVEGFTQRVVLYTPPQPSRGE